MPPPYVNGARFDGTQMWFTVLVDDFDAHDYVEITGAATQTRGAFAMINHVVPVPEKTPDGKASVEIGVAPGPGRNFIEGDDVTVFIRVSRVWVTVLGKSSNDSDPDHPGGPKGEPRWGVRNFSELYPPQPAVDGP